jgi:hypothetical protein
MRATSLTVRLSLWQHKGCTILYVLEGTYGHLVPILQDPLLGRSPCLDRFVIFKSPTKRCGLLKQAATLASYCDPLHSRRLRLPFAGFAGKIGARSAELEPATFSVRSWTGWMSADLAYVRKTFT